MSDICTKEIYDASRKRRVLIVRRENGSFGFDEEFFSDEPLELCWVSRGQFPLSICDSENTALKEATGRIGWLAEAIAQQSVQPDRREDAAPG